ADGVRHRRVPVLTGSGLLIVGVAPFVLEAGAGAGVLAIGPPTGPPPLPAEDPAHQDAGRPQQPAEDAERAAQQAGPAAGAVAGGHHPAFAMSMVREPSKAGTVTSSRTSVRSPRPT